MFGGYSQGDRLSLSRLISLIENNAAERDEISKRLHPFLKGAYRIGLTGPPGVGKSTLVTELVKEFRERNSEVKIGIIAVDPSSPFTGGALLGDRIRMNRISLEPNVFIRSLATRGSLGGLALATEDVADLMDGFGCEIIIIETVGVGQAELDIVKSSDTTLVALIPGSGDSIQAMKAGLMEIGNIFIINKCDREGADRAYIELETALHFKPFTGWKVPVIKTTANKSEGCSELADAIFTHKEYLLNKGKLEDFHLERRKKKIRSVTDEKILNTFWDENKEELLIKLSEQDIPVIKAVQRLLESETGHNNKAETD